MTPVSVPETMNELTDGTVGSVGAATGAASGPYWESGSTTSKGGTLRGDATRRSGTTRLIDRG